jgi:EAL domain-containing protein (putative c-di-GMP-specific phosphodiesterase class I)
MSMAVNLSPRQLRDGGLVERVRAVLASNKIAAHRLELEITESEILAQLEVDRSKLGVLREIGVKIAIDDFGTGHSSLARLMQLPIDRLKLDRSFICELEGEGESRARAITAAIVNMGHALGVGMIAEGVETPAQYDLLSEQGCHVIQGFLTGRPMRPENLPGWLSDKAARASLGHVR